jgi:hypothetical protein
MGNGGFAGQEVGEVLGYFDKGLTRARQRYRRFVAEGIEVGHREDLVGAGRKGRRGKNGGERNQPADPRILGDKRFSEGILSNRPLKEKARVLFPLPDLIQKVSSVLGIESELIGQASKSRSLAEARAMICYMAIRELGYSGLELGRELNLGSAGVSRALKRAESVFRENSEIKRSILLEIGK